MADRIKIAYIIGALDRGGAEVFLVNLLKNLDREKFTPIVITVTGGGELALEIENLGVPLYVLKKKGKLGIGVIFQIKKILQRENPAIVHTQLFAGDTWGRAAAILAGVKKIVVTEQNINPDEGFIKKRLKWFLSLFTDRVVCITKAVEQYSIKKDWIDAKKTMVIPNGIILADFDPYFNTRRQFGSEARNKQIITCVANFKPQKGHEYLVRAFALIIEKFSHVELLLVGAGVGKHNTLPKIKKLVERLNLRDKIKFLGTRSDVAQILAATDIFVLPSLWEGQGIVFLEAGYVGVPVIASDVGGIKEAVLNGKTGILVPKENEKELARAMMMLLAAPDQREKMGCAAHEFVKNNFDLQKIVQKYEQLYLYLLS